MPTRTIPFIPCVLATWRLPVNSFILFKISPAEYPYRDDQQHGHVNDGVCDSGGEEICRDLHSQGGFGAECVGREVREDVIDRVENIFRGGRTECGGQIAEAGAEMADDKDEERQQRRKCRRRKG